MMDAQFDHEKLDVYRVSIEFIAWLGPVVAGLEGPYRHARDQMMRSSQSIPLNIAEGLGKRSPKDRSRYLEIARGSAMEAAASLDVLVAARAVRLEDIRFGKEMLLRIVSMLSRMTEPRDAAEREQDG